MASSALASPAPCPPPCGNRHPHVCPAAVAATAPVSCRVGAAARCRAVAAPTGPSPPGVAERPEADVVVIGSGLGGLCCAGLLVRYGQDVVVLESHDRPGGAAHSFDVKVFHFDSGPSLFSCFQSRGPQANPLAQVTLH